MISDVPATYLAFMIDKGIFASRARAEQVRRLDIAAAPTWWWWAGFDAEVEHEGLWALGEFGTRDEAVAAGLARMPDIDGNHFFHIIEATFGEMDDSADFQPFGLTRNRVTISAQPGEA